MSLHYPNTSKYHRILHGIIRGKNGPRLLCLAKYTEPCIADSGGVVGSLASGGKRILRNSFLLGVRINVQTSIVKQLELGSL